MTTRTISLLVVACCLAGSTTARAEVSVDPGKNDGAANTLILGIIIEDSDPLGVAWQPFRPIAPERVLNSGGHARGDGRPDLVYGTILDDPDPTTAKPVVVWSYNTSADGDIAIAEWSGSAWSPITFLTSGSEDDLDPRLTIEPDGTRHVVWWTGGAEERVYLATRPTGTSVWSTSVLVASPARRPTVAVHDGILRVAYERTSTQPGVAQEVVVLREDLGGGFVVEAILPTTRTQRLDPVLHARGDRLWLDWKHAEDLFGYVRFEQGTWSTIDEPAWSDPSWVGVEATRKSIAGDVLLP